MWDLVLGDLANIYSLWSIPRFHLLGFIICNVFGPPIGLSRRFKVLTIGGHISLSFHIWSTNLLKFCSILCMPHLLFGFGIWGPYLFLSKDHTIKIWKCGICSTFQLHVIGVNSDFYVGVWLSSIHLEWVWILTMCLSWWCMNKLNTLRISMNLDDKLRWKVFLFGDMITQTSKFPR